MKDIQTIDYISGERLVINEDKLMALRAVNANCTELTLESEGGCIEALRVKEDFASLGEKLEIELRPSGLEDLKGESWVERDRILKRYV